MRHILASSLIALGFSIASPALASGFKKFESTVSAPLQQPVKLEVVLSEDMAYRADNLPKKLRDRSPGRSGLNSGFSNNGFYGERELERLTQRLEDKMERRLIKEGVQIDDNASTVLRVTIVEAKPNRPTFTQLGKEPGLSSRSFGIGGAEMRAELIAAGGQPLGEMSYKWYESDIRDAAFGGTWSDAYRAFDRFARKAADNLTY